MTLSQQLTQIIQDKTDLYKTFGFKTPLDSPPQTITTTQLFKNYRRLALRYHPDKHLRQDKHNCDLSDKFHQLSLAIQILQDADLRRQYDSWYVNTYIPRIKIDTERKVLIDKLEKGETQETQIKHTETGPSFAEVQKYGELLRKLKHFNKGYRNWRDLQIVEETEEDKEDKEGYIDVDVVDNNECKYPESATIRVELSLRGNGKNNDNNGHINSLLEKDRLLDYLDSLRLVDKTRLQDVYYSSRNVCQSNCTTIDSLVCYLVFKTVEDAYKFYKGTTTTNTTSIIKRVSPRIPVEYYRHSAVVPLDDEIRRRCSL